MLTQLLDDLREGLPLDELHRVVVDAALAADRVDVDDAGMLQRRGGLGLILEPLEMPRVENRRKGQHLQSHPAAERNLLGLIHHAHAAAPNLAQDAELAQLAQTGRVGPKRVGYGTAISRRLPEVVQRRQGGNQMRDFIGQVGVAGDERLDVGPLAGAEAGLDFLGQLAIRQIPKLLGLGRRDGETVFPVGDVHGPVLQLPDSAKRISFSRTSARP